MTPDDEGTLTNPAGICRVDPDGQVPETDEDEQRLPGKRCRGRDLENLPVLTGGVEANGVGGSITSNQFNIGLPIVRILHQQYCQSRSAAMFHNRNLIKDTNKVRISTVALLLALLASLLAFAQPARAANYVVLNSNDSGPGSLRQAITNANNNAGPDTITFSAATDGNPIVLSGAAGEDGNASGDLDILDILDGGDLTIQGNGSANTIIDGGDIDRVFHVCPGGGCTNTITITGVYIRNGTATNGGGIAIEAGTTTISDSLIHGNTATNNGGGIYNNGGTTTVSSSFIGGIKYVGPPNTAGNSGGGIFNESGTMTIDGSTVRSNTATTNGGGIFNKSTLNIQNGSIIGGAIGERGRRRWRHLQRGRHDDVDAAAQSATTL